MKIYAKMCFLRKKEFIVDQPSDNDIQCLEEALLTDDTTKLGKYRMPYIQRVNVFIRCIQTGAFHVCQALFTRCTSIPNDENADVQVYSAIKRIPSLSKNQIECITWFLKNVTHFDLFEHILLQDDIALFTLLQDALEPSFYRSILFQSASWFRSKPYLDVMVTNRIPMLFWQVYNIIKLRIDSPRFYEQFGRGLDYILRMVSEFHEIEDRNKLQTVPDILMLAANTTNVENALFVVNELYPLIVRAALNSDQTEEYFKQMSANKIYAMRSVTSYITPTVLFASVRGDMFETFWWLASEDTRHIVSQNPKIVYKAMCYKNYKAVKFLLFTVGIKVDNAIMVKYLNLLIAEAMEQSMENPPTDIEYKEYMDEYKEYMDSEEDEMIELRRHHHRRQLPVEDEDEPEPSSSNEWNPQLGLSETMRLAYTSVCQQNDPFQNYPDKHRRRWKELLGGCMLMAHECYVEILDVLLVHGLDIEGNDGWSRIFTNEHMSKHTFTRLFMLGRHHYNTIKFFEMCSLQCIDEDVMLWHVREFMD